MAKAQPKRPTLTPKQRVTRALDREKRLTTALKKAAKGSATYKKLKSQIKAAQRAQKAGYKARTNKIRNESSQDAVRKSSKAEKKSSSHGKKTKNTSKRKRTKGSSKSTSRSRSKKKKR